MTSVRERIQAVIAELKASGLRQTQIGEKLGITQASVSSYSRGDQDVSVPVAMLIESKFGYRKEWLLTGDLPKMLDKEAILGDVSRISKQGRELDKMPEIRDLLPLVAKLKDADYNMLVELIKKIVRK